MPIFGLLSQPASRLRKKIHNAGPQGPESGVVSGSLLAPLHRLPVRSLFRRTALQTLGQKG